MWYMQPYHPVMTSTLRQALAELEAELAQAEEAQEKAAVEFERSTQAANRRRLAVRAMREIVAELEGDEPPAQDVVPATEGRPAAAEPTAEPKNGVSEAPSTPSRRTASGTKRRKSREDILAIMFTDPTEPWSLQRLVDAMTERGWANHLQRPHAAIEHSAARLVIDGRLVRVEPGVYRLRSDLSALALNRQAATEILRAQVLPPGLTGSQSRLVGDGFTLTSSALPQEGRRDLTAG